MTRKPPLAIISHFPSVAIRDTPVPTSLDLSLKYRDITVHDRLRAPRAEPARDSHFSALLEPLHRVSSPALPSIFLILPSARLAPITSCYITMCVRTKTSWGCGCAHKSTEECGSQSCTGIVRFLFLKDGDCAECKRGGSRVTRGREGKGRYAQELRLRDTGLPVTRPPLSPISTNITPSPWAAPRSREKEWRSPVRQKADDAWLVEHERRQRDLEITSQQMSSWGSPSTPTKDHARNPRRRNEHAARVQDEIRRLEDAERSRLRRRAERSNSYDSFDTMNSAITPSRGRTFDSGFSLSSSPYTFKISSHHGLGRGLGDIVRDCARSRSRW